MNTHPHCAGHPMTIGRIRDWSKAFAGAPVSRVPFGAHAAKYLLWLLEQDPVLASRIEFLEMRQGVHEKRQHEKRQDAGNPTYPWVLAPRDDQGWARRVANYEGLGLAPHAGAGREVKGRTIPYAHASSGTEKFPDFEAYEESRHEDERTLTGPEARSERNQSLRDRERKCKAAEAQPLE